MSKISFPGGGAGGGGGVSDHGGLAGLGDDDHTQYLLRSDFASSGAAGKPTVSGTNVGAGTQVYISGISVGDKLLTDHGQQAGLTDDDHSQYLLMDGSRTDVGTTAMSGVFNAVSGQFNDSLTISGVEIGDYLSAHATDTSGIGSVSDDAGTKLTPADLVVIGSGGIETVASGASTLSVVIPTDTFLPWASGAELNDHGNMVGLSDDDHTQYLLRQDFATSGDARYFQETEHVSVFTGPTDNGKPVVLNADGKINAALLESGIGGGTTVISTPTALTSFVEASAKNTEEHIHGGIHALNTGAALSAGSPLVVGTKGVGKLFLVVNAGADTTGTITVTGRSVDRNTGVEVEGDTSTITLAGLSTDNSDTDAGGHDQHKFGDVDFTSKWYRGSVLLTTADVDLSDVDIYHCSFEQFNDHTDYTITTFDINTEHNGFDNGELYAHLYKVQRQQDGRFTVSGIADLSIPAGSGVANEQQRLRAGGLAVAMSGSSDGIFVDMWFDNQQFLYTTTKVWASMQVNTAFNVDHGSLSGLTDDDHTQYVLVDGTRDFTGGVTPDTSGIRDFGSRTKVWASGFFDGIVLTAATDGSKWKLTVDPSGGLTTTAV